MTLREITLIGGPHDGRTLPVDDRFVFICTVQTLRNPIPPPPPLKWWERLLRRKPAPPPLAFEPFTFIQHKYDARTGQHINTLEDK